MGFVLSVSSNSRHIWRVIVRKNIVMEIQRIPATEQDQICDDPLKASTKLSQNNLKNGCLDGDYDFATFETAHHFSTLCAGYLKSLCEKIIERLSNDDSLGEHYWNNEVVPHSWTVRQPS